MKWREEKLSVCIKKERNQRESTKKTHVCLVCQLFFSGTRVWRCRHIKSPPFKVAFSHQSEMFLLFFFLYWLKLRTDELTLWRLWRLKRHILVLDSFSFLKLLWTVNPTLSDNLRSERSCAVKRVRLTQNIQRESVLCSLLRRLNTTTRLDRWTSHHHWGFLCFSAVFHFVAPDP